MISKDRAKVFEELHNVADRECNLLADDSTNVGTIHEELIMLAYKYAPLKELRKLIVKGKQMVNELEELDF
tara:strand:- start:421 stop:633 length:213 start_codon:yes stop_codon:yes gene_type:complete